MVRAGTWRDSAELDEKDRLGLELAERMSATPPTVDDAFFARLAAVFEPRAIVDMVAICAWEHYRARVNVALGVKGQGLYRPDSD